MAVINSRKIARLFEIIVLKLRTTSLYSCMFVLFWNRKFPALLRFVSQPALHSAKFSTCHNEENPNAVI